MRSKKLFLAVILLLLLPACAFGTTYYVKNGGNDSADGLSDANAWETINKVNITSFSTGDDVYFKCGDTFAPSSPLDIDWEGTDVNPAVIGAYYMDGGETVGVSGSRPVISGSNYTVPSDQGWQGLVRVVEKDYVHIQDIEVYRSGFYGIQIVGDLNTLANSAYFKIDNVFTNGSGNAGIIINKNPSNYGVIENCEVKHAGWGWASGAWGGTFPSALVISNCPDSNTTVRNNLVQRVWGQGIGITRISVNSEYEDSGYVTVEDNTVYCSYSAAIYADGTRNNIIRRNLVLGPSSSAADSQGADEPATFNRYFAEAGRNWTGSNISINQEDRLNGATNALVNNEVYNNFVAGGYRGIGFNAGNGTTGTISGNKIFNNTVIGARYNYKIGQYLNDTTLTNNEIKNNISFCPADTSTSCSDFESVYSWMDTSLDFDYNAWESSPTYGAGANDILTDTNFTKISGWQSLTDVTSADNFKLTSGSNAVDEGTTIATFSDDYFETSRSGTWDIGAHEYGNAPAAPTTSFEEQSGLVSMEAENYTTRTTDGTDTWTLITDGAYVGGEAMQALPDDGTDHASDTNGPHLSYSIDFTTTGTYYIWVRGTGILSGNSAHIGVDGTNLGYPDRIDFDIETDWHNLGATDAVLSTSIATSGEHTFDIWMREDGITIDKIVLTTDSGYTPSGDGPDETLPQATTKKVGWWQ